MRRILHRTWHICQIRNIDRADLCHRIGGPAPATLSDDRRLLCCSLPAAASLEIERVFRVHRHQHDVPSLVQLDRDVVGIPTRLKCWLVGKGDDHGRWGKPPSSSPALGGQAWRFIKSAEESPILARSDAPHLLSPAWTLAKACLPAFAYLLIMNGKVNRHREEHGKPARRGKSLDERKPLGVLSAIGKRSAQRCSWKQGVAAYSIFDVRWVSTGYGTSFRSMRIKLEKEPAAVKAVHP